MFSPLSPHLCKIFYFRVQNLRREQFNESHKQNLVKGTGGWLKAASVVPKVNFTDSSVVSFYFSVVSHQNLLM